MAPPVKSSRPGKRLSNGTSKQDKPPSTFHLNGRLFTLNQHIFSLWCDVDNKPRWYAARVAGSSGDKLTITWAEGGGRESVDPLTVLPAEQVLRHGIIVNIPDQPDDQYMEYRMVRYRTTGWCAVRGKLGMLKERSFDEMMLEPADLRRFSGSGQVKTKLNLLTGYGFLISTGVHAAKELMIIQFGGTVFKSLQKLEEWRKNFPVNRRRSFLIADSPLRTEKFLYCLVANIPCVSSKWIEKIRSSKKVLDFEIFRQLAGEEKSPGQPPVPIVWRPRKTLLNNLRIAIHLDSTLRDYWQPILTVGMGEEIVLVTAEDFPEIGVENMDIVMVASAAPVGLISVCREELVPLVTQQWLIDTIIYGKRRPFLLYSPLQSVL